MKRKVLSLIAASLLMTTTLIPCSKAIAQGLVEYALILVVVSIGNTETAEFYWRTGPSQAKPQGTAFSRASVKLAYILTDTLDATCTQTIQAPVETTSGLNILRLAVSHGFLVVNGEQVGEKLADCLQTAARRAYQVGTPVPPHLVDQLKADPNVLPAGFNMPEFLSVFVVGPDGESTRSGSWVGKGAEAFWAEIMR